MGNLAVKLYTPKVYSEAGLRWIDDNAIRAPQTLPRARARARGSRETVCALGQDAFRRALVGCGGVGRRGDVGPCVSG